MGKNKARNKAKARRTKTSRSDEADTSSQPTSSSAPASADQPPVPASSPSASQTVVPANQENTPTDPFTVSHTVEMPSNFTSRFLARFWGFRQDVVAQQPPNTVPTDDAEAPPHHTSASTPHVQEPEGKSTPDIPKVKRDSVISTTSTGPPQDAKVKAKPPPRQRSKVQVGQWLSQCWPCRLVRWMYHFAAAFTQVRWNDQQRFVDLLLTLGLAALFLFGCYLVLEFVQSALPLAAAQSLGGNCSVVYVTIPGPIITVSLIGASPTDPARGTYYFSVVNGTTEWLNGIAPPSRFSTMVTQTPVVTPVISSVPVAGSSISATSSPLNSVPPGPIGQPQRPYPSYPNLDASTSTVPGLPSGSSEASPISGPTSVLTSVSTTTLTSTLSDVPSSDSSRPNQSAISAVQSTVPGESTLTISSIIPITSPDEISVPTSTDSLPGEPTSTMPSMIPVISTNSIPVPTSTDGLPVTSSALTSNSSLASSLVTTPTSESFLASYSSLFFVSSTGDLTSPVTLTISTTFLSTLLSGDSTVTTAMPTVTTLLSTESAVGPSLSSPSVDFSMSLSRPVTTTTSDLVPSGTITPSISTSIETSSSGSIGAPTGSPILTITSLVPVPSDLAPSDTTTSLGLTPTEVPYLGSTEVSTASSPLTVPPPVAIPSGTTSFSVSTSTGSFSPDSTSRVLISSPTLILPTQTDGPANTTPGLPLPDVFSSLVSSAIDSSSLAASSQMTNSLTSSLPSDSVTVPLESLSSTPISVNRPETPVLSVSPLPGTESLPFASASSTFTPTFSSLPVSPISSLSPSPSIESSPLATSTTSSLSLSNAISNSSITPSFEVTQPVSTFGTTSTSSTTLVVPPPLNSSFSLNMTSSSAYSSASSMFLSSEPILSSSTSFSPSFSTSFVTLIPVANVSSSTMLNSSTSTTTSTSTITVTSTVLLTNSSLSSSFGETSSFVARAITRVIAYGDNRISFVFPSPNISTTISYWTGTYPTVTGPLPSEFATLPLTTRTARQTPLSEPPSFERFSSTSKCVKTTVLSISGDNSTTALGKRQGIPVTVGVSSPSLQITTQTPSTAAQPNRPGPSLCGESGNFTLRFDDTVVDEETTGLLVASGMKNPYHHLFYANGYTYVPDKWEPYPAISQPNVAMFMPLGGRLLPNTPFAGTMLPGELGAGPRAPVNAYWFNAYSGYFGCALNGLTPCTLRISGYRWDNALQQEVVVAEQNVTIPACPGYAGCRLTQVVFSNAFRALSGIQFNAYTYNLNIPQVHVMDDVQMEWYNNTCAAGILRIGHR